MTIGIVGLGLIGGSLAKAYKRNQDITVLGYDIDESTVEFAQIAGDIDGVLTPDRLVECDLALISTYPQASMDYLEAHADDFSKTGIVMDCVGVKQAMCDFAFPLAAAHGFTFVGGHPMGGTQFSGLKYAKANMFDRAPMVIVPPVYDDAAFLARVKSLLKPAGFGPISVTTAKQHDEMIAFTSQLCHVVSNAYIKSPTAGTHRGFSAGSYRDLTRVAWLNPDMWSELLLDNRANILSELDGLLENLNQYRDALANADQPALRALLDEGRKRKEQIDG
ncbi:MAG: prephenate dehydrogenase/arogenate dehydrogenase family protein [Oscillospiraceae bacterium]|nr:prephenate dehydrogenase/arogenate dehydrogenase family protein [Oscillospiraceae bacterium]